ncbi:Hypothetical predicted protein [Olea europaea subsp. europaea]|uniref:Uncharacterized protein n=1 Tax=Olea europaea subsp. europaea TaxID=158383 RepID=A0A8S0UJJ8_OLEEU|nr:Hypothetical predicted protein [Olea europaea subsp. europaea]
MVEGEMAISDIRDLELGKKSSEGQVHELDGDMGVVGTQSVKALYDEYAEDKGLTFVDLAGNHLTRKDFTETFDAEYFPFALFSNSIDHGWASAFEDPRRVGVSDGPTISIPIVDGNEEGRPLSDTQVVTEQIDLKEMDDNMTPTIANEPSRSRVDARKVAWTSTH